ncbi:hypothetical protein Lal_00026947 [Lupinus albus]|nr:hypothetical protein Lal_00026947 [Lupinus albus]
MTIHLFCDYRYARPMWNTLIPSNNHHSFYTTNLVDWISGKLDNAVLVLENNMKIHDFSLLLWSIWKMCNQVVFNVRTFDLYQVYYNAVRVTKDIIVSAHPRRWVEILPLQIGLNGIKNMVGCGGVGRDHSGRWIFGFYKNLELQISYGQNFRPFSLLLL